MSQQYLMLMYIVLGMIGWIIAPLCLVTYGVLQAKGTSKVGLKKGCLIYSLSFFAFALRAYIAPFLSKGFNFQLLTIFILILILFFSSVLLNLKWLFSEFKKKDFKSKAYIRFSLFLFVLTIPYAVVLLSNLRLALATS